MKFPYMEVRPGIYRPIIAVRIYGPLRRLLTDGLLDTGSDHTLLPPNTARELGIDTDALPIAFTMQSATGHRLTCKTVKLCPELVRESARVCWETEVVVTVEPIRKAHWGIKGFLEYFNSNFDGPGRWATFNPGANLPAASPPE